MSKNILGKMDIGDTVSFDLHVSSVLPQDYSLVKIEGVIPANLCDKFGTDVYALHAQIYRLVPEGTMDNNPESYSYLLVKTQDKEYRVIGLPWINADTIKVYKQNKVTFGIINCAEEDIALIRNAIARRGYHVTITREDVSVE